MKLPVPSTCCCCCSLKTGTLVLGWLCLVCSCLNVLGVIKELAMLGDIERILEQEVYDECDVECRAFVHSFILGLLVVSLIMDLLMVGLSSALIYGVNKKKPRFMTPFLGYIIVSNAFLVILWVSLMVVFYQVPVACVLLTVFLGLVFALNFHFFTVIRGHQNEVIAEHGNVHIRLDADEGGFSSAKDY